MHRLIAALCLIAMPACAATIIVDRQARQREFELSAAAATTPTWTFEVMDDGAAHTAFATATGTLYAAATWTSAPWTVGVSSGVTGTNRFVVTPTMLATATSGTFVAQFIIRNSTGSVVEEWSRGALTLDPSPATMGLAFTLARDRDMGGGRITSLGHPSNDTDAVNYLTLTQHVGATIPEAPVDGTTYGRRNAAWFAIGGAGAETDPVWGVVSNDVMRESIYVRNTNYNASTVVDGARSAGSAGSWVGEFADDAVGQYYVWDHEDKDLGLMGGSAPLLGVVWADGMWQVGQTRNGAALTNLNASRITSGKLTLTDNIDGSYHNATNFNELSADSVIAGYKGSGYSGQHFWCSGAAGFDGEVRILVDATGETDAVNRRTCTNLIRTLAMTTKTNWVPVSWVTAANTNVIPAMDAGKTRTLVGAWYKVRSGSGIVQFARQALGSTYNAYTNIGGAISVGTTPVYVTFTGATITAAETLVAKWTTRTFTNATLHVKYTESY